MQNAELTLKMIEKRSNPQSSLKENDQQSIQINNNFINTDENTNQILLNIHSQTDMESTDTLPNISQNFNVTSLNDFQSLATPSLSSNALSYEPNPGSCTSWSPSVLSALNINKTIGETPTRTLFIRNIGRGHIEKTEGEEKGENAKTKKENEKPKGFETENTKEEYNNDDLKANGTNSNNPENKEVEEILKLFEQFGEIKSFYSDNIQNGYVMISYYDIRNSENALNAMQGKLYHGRNLAIHFSIPGVCIIFI